MRGDKYHGGVPTDRLASTRSRRHHQPQHGGDVVGLLRLFAFGTWQTWYENGARWFFRHAPWVARMLQVRSSAWWLWKRQKAMERQLLGQLDGRGRFFDRRNALIAAAALAVGATMMAPQRAGANAVIGSQEGSGGADGVLTVYNVKEAPFFAAGNGTTNDTTVQTTAATAAASTNGILFYPPGTYVTNGAATPAQTTGFITIQGSGQYSTILKSTVQPTGLMPGSLNASYPVNRPGYANPTLLLAMPGEVTDMTVDGGGVSATALAASFNTASTVDWVAFRRITATNVNKTSAGNGWNHLVVNWYEPTASVGLITTLVLEDVTVLGPSHNTFDSTAYNDFQTCYVSRMNLLNLTQSATFFADSHLLIIDGLYCNGVTGSVEGGAVLIAQPGSESGNGVATTIARGIVIDDSSGSYAGIEHGSSTIIMSDSICGGMGLNGFNGRWRFSNCQFTNSIFIGPAVNWLTFDDCDFGVYAISPYANPTGPIFMTNCTATDGPLFYGGTGSGGPTTIDVRAVNCQFAGPVNGGVGSLAATAYFRNCTGLNPATLVAPAFPATTVTYTNATGYDLYAYITNGAAAMTTKVNGNTGPSIAALGTMAVFIPAGGTFTPTYASGSPSWVFQGN